LTLVEARSTFDVEVGW